MLKHFFLLSVAPFALVSPALASETAPAKPAEPTEKAEAPAPAPQAQKEVFSTGVAKGRDRLDSATSTSSLRDAEIQKLGARSLAEIFRNIPGIRAEASAGEGNNSYSIRGLPLASSGSKFLQFQEDGLPVMEFGDFSYISPDLFLRADLNLAAIETIRGGSASTFASNSPGGVINLISKTGDVEGGAVQVSSGIDFDEKRVDFEYGTKVSDTLRFHVGGFYRSGEGPRSVGYSAKGGQIKLNVTKTFDGGFIRLYGKYLDDRSPAYLHAPIRVTGTNDNPKYSALPGFDLTKDALLSRYITSGLTLDGSNRVSRIDVTDGLHPVMKSAGVEAQFDIAGFTISEKFRYSSMSGTMNQIFPLSVAPAAALAPAFGGPGARLSYASGPFTGNVINPATVNGNGLLASSLLQQFKVNSVDNATNDLRASRVWKLGGGDLTATAGIYKSRQSLDTEWLFTSLISDVRGDGRAALVNITTATGIAQTQGGFFAYSALPATAGYRRAYDVDYDVTAPYGSLNYHFGKIAIGGSLRYDIGRARGTLFGSELGGTRVGVTTYDINGDGVISAAETRTGILPLTAPAPVDYDYKYLSYSTGINFRIAEPLAVFARYSKGGRASADRILFTPAVNSLDGSLTDSKNAYDSVKQAELGVKFRQSDITLNVTGFLANTGERNLQINTTAAGAVQVERVIRSYRAYGAEFEGGIRRGPFSLTAGATYTHAEIKSDEFHPEFIGNTPRHQANFIFQATPQYEGKHITVGANVIGTTSSYAQDSNLLKMPGYTTVNAFFQFRPIERVQLMVNAANLFDVTALTEVTQPSIPASGIVTARALNGRTISTALRFDF